MKLCKYKLMRQIQMLSFACHETALYLDGHPNDRRAVAFFDEKNSELKQAVNLYEQNFGPLTANSFDGNGSWTWIEGPWPWKYEANAAVE